MRSLPAWSRYVFVAEGCLAVGGAELMASSDDGSAEEAAFAVLIAVLTLVLLSAAVGIAFSRRRDLGLLLVNAIGMAFVFVAVMWLFDRQGAATWLGYVVIFVGTATIGAVASLLGNLIARAASGRPAART
jgi:hypothetical protein